MEQIRIYRPALIVAVSLVALQLLQAVLRFNFSHGAPGFTFRSDWYSGFLLTQLVVNTLGPFYLVFGPDTFFVRLVRFLRFELAMWMILALVQDQLVAGCFWGVETHFGAIALVTAVLELLRRSNRLRVSGVKPATNSTRGFQWSLQGLLLVTAEISLVLVVHLRAGGNNAYRGTIFNHHSLRMFPTPAVASSALIASVALAVGLIAVSRTRGLKLAAVVVGILFTFVLLEPWNEETFISLATGRISFASLIARYGKIDSVFWLLPLSMFVPVVLGVIQFVRSCGIDVSSNSAVIAKA